MVMVLLIVNKMCFYIKNIIIIVNSNTVITIVIILLLKLDTLIIKI